MNSNFQLPRIKEDIDIDKLIPAKYIGNFTLNDIEKEKEIFEIKTSNYIKRIRSQYLLIERELIKTFEYVEPNVDNYKTNSVRFASIIRESCNLFELVSRELCSKLLHGDIKKLNTKNFLMLDIHLDFRGEKLSSPYIMVTDNEKTLDIFPFENLLKWDRESEITSEFIPEWWKAYNKIKHEQEGIKYATLQNALLAISGIYILINSIYGEGVLIGGLNYYHKKDPFNIIYSTYRIEQSQLFTFKTFKSEKMF
ncbi:hypothetical protein [Paenibacillus xylanivorans]|uniref:Uncharacterized protein n=1 Tax=Paenibacillus xylanivorans TaxID=1705561 RepID=A0A0N1IWT0_9BACL|nr:hypothetical protein [Paenibacillus xylanivorans]KOY16785.1 hypothetical protein AMS66_07845 [Paenibacillus xylanivorans]